MKAYKLFRLMKDNTIAPLFINATMRLEEGVWYQAELHETKGFSVRQGWHCCLTPLAPHLSMKPKGGSKRIWVEVDVEDYKMYDRPESQGNSWVLAQRIRVVRRRPDIINTTGE